MKLQIRNKDLIWVKVSDEQTTTITYSEFLKYFEY